MLKRFGFIKPSSGFDKKDKIVCMNNDGFFHQNNGREKLVHLNVELTITNKFIPFVILCFALILIT